MRKVLITIFTIALVAGLSMAADLPAPQIVKADFTTATQASNQVSTVVNQKGYIQEINYIPSGTFTSKVVITFTPTGASTPQYVYTNYTATAQITVRPRVDTTDNAGVALTDDSPTRYLASGGVLNVMVTNVTQTAGTSAIVLIKTEK